jgi:excisionase family DNA binding protein
VSGKRDDNVEPLPQVLMIVPEVAGLLRVSKMTVYRLVHSGELPSMRVGRGYRISKAAVEERLGDMWPAA